MRILHRTPLVVLVTLALLLATVRDAQATSRAPARFALAARNVLSAVEGIVERPLNDARTLTELGDRVSEVERASTPLCKRSGKGTGCLKLPFGGRRSQGEQMLLLTDAPERSTTMPPISSQSGSSRSQKTRFRAFTMPSVLKGVSRGFDHSGGQDSDVFEDTLRWAQRQEGPPPGFKPYRKLENFGRLPTDPDGSAGATLPTEQKPSAESQMQGFAADSGSELRSGRAAEHSMTGAATGLKLNNPKGELHSRRINHLHEQRNALGPPWSTW